MPNNILVSIICICHNQAAYVAGAIQSALGQKYPHIQLILADDASTDHSKTIIKEILKQHSEIIFLDFEQNIGNCRVFNAALEHAKGKYVIDLAADDLLLEGCVGRQVAALENNPAAALCFSDAMLSDASSKITQRYYSQSWFKNGIIPQGFVFKDLFLASFICPPTVMFEVAKLRSVGGYDPTLAYEDFDIWVRLARDFPFVHIADTLVIKRIISGSLSDLSVANRQKNKLASTLIICQKALILAKTKDETEAILGFMRWHLRLAARLGVHDVARDFAGQIGRVHRLYMMDRLALGLAGRLWPLVEWFYTQWKTWKKKI